MYFNTISFCQAENNWHSVAYVNRHMQLVVILTINELKVISRFKVIMVIVEKLGCNEAELSRYIHVCFCVEIHSLLLSNIVRRKIETYCVRGLADLAQTT